MRASIITGLLIVFSCLAPFSLHAFCFEEAGNRFNINPHLLKSIARVESGLNPKAVNKNLNGSTDLGLMQINSSWLKTLNVTESELMNDACLNTMTGAWVLRQCIDRHGYTWEAVGCYNAYSPEKRVNYAWKVFNKLKGNTKESQQALEEGKVRKASSVRQGGRVQSRPSLVFRVRDVSEMDRASP